jgi:hypothetical protein
LSSLSTPRRTIFKATSGNGRCKAFASSQGAQNAPSDLADDMLEGAEAIAESLFGSREFRRKIYYLAECSKLPIFRLRSALCARESVLLRFISGQEDRALSQES